VVGAAIRITLRGSSEPGQPKPEESKTMGFSAKSRQPQGKACQGSGNPPASTSVRKVRGSGGVVRPGTRAQCGSCPEDDATVTPSGAVAPHRPR
jgi:hypothetical protein